MTAEEFVNGKLGDKNYTHSPFPMHRQVICEWLDEYALQIAEKAVAEVLEEYDTVGLISPVIIAGRILNRIKTEIGGE